MSAVKASPTFFLAALPAAETHLRSHDPILAKLIDCETARWPSQPSENPIWGLVRIVMAQQVSTLVACRIAEKTKLEYPHLTTPSPSSVPEVGRLRALGLPQRRAQCCVEIISRSEEILAKIEKGSSWDDALKTIKGIGPWTISVFKIMVLRHPDVLPAGDVGLERAIDNVYGESRDVTKLSEKWQPFRSVACWYLWRTLGNLQLG